MGKIANEKRKQLFAELEKRELEKPAVKVKDRGKATKPFRYPATESRKRVADLRCCIVKHPDDLPIHFVRCRDCPLDTSPETC